MHVHRLPSKHRPISCTCLSKGLRDAAMLYQEFSLTRAKIRSDTAEYLYLVLQSKDIGNHTDEAEDVLLETEWYALVVGRPSLQWLT
jgi:hypothetical protein